MVGQEQLERDVTEIKRRNARVEAEKAWETSIFRVLVIAGLTYVVAAQLLYYLDVSRFYLAALVPALGYFLSMQSLPIIKRKWMRRYERKRTLQ